MLDQEERVTDTEITGDYPMVRCAVHKGRPLPGYSVCAHVANGADIATHFAPSNDSLGHVVCARCREDELSSNSMRLTRVALALELHCMECVNYHLGARLPLAEVEDDKAVIQ